MKLPIISHFYGLSYRNKVALVSKVKVGEIDHPQSTGVETFLEEATLKLDDEDEASPPIGEEEVSNTLSMLRP
ncbi:hypothetical protein J6590_079461 [Homalodisca vitripennis]|nr:hypothetical protein J6590_079461 [Homalodisca vitripennis]